MYYLNLFAWTVFAQAKGAGEGGNSDPPSSLTFFLPIIVIVILAYFMLLRPEKQKQQKRQSLLDNLKKNDRVVTIGGIYGIITHVNKNADEATIRIDDSTNTKMKITFGAIARVVTDNEDDSKENRTDK